MYAIGKKISSTYIMRSRCLLIELSRSGSNEGFGIGTYAKDLG